MSGFCEICFLENFWDLNWSAAKLRKLKFGRIICQSDTKNCYMKLVMGTIILKSLFIVLKKILSCCDAVINQLITALQ